MEKEKKNLGFKKLIPIIAAFIIVAGGAFYGGMRFQEYQTKSRFGKMASGMPGLGRSGASNANVNRRGSMIDGEIISKDDKSITVKTQDGSTKIVYFTDSTTVAKQAKVSSSDLTNGLKVMVNGQANSDGSIAALNIQIRD